MTRKKARLYGVLLLVAGVAAAAALTLTALKDNVSYFRTPTEIVTGKYPEYGTNRGLRLGGMVEKGSVVHNGDEVTFRVTDYANSLPIHYRGLLPDLFREGTGVVAEGHMDKDTFTADRILAKHDEKYMPPEVTKALKDAPKPSPPAKP